MSGPRPITKGWPLKKPPSTMTAKITMGTTGTWPNRAGGELAGGRALTKLRAGGRPAIGP